MDDLYDFNKNILYFYIKYRVCRTAFSRTRNCLKVPQKLITAGTAWITRPEV